MIARPAAALSCRNCQRAVYRAVLSPSNSFAQRTVANNLPLRPRPFGTSRQLYGADDLRTPETVRKSENHVEQLDEKVTSSAAETQSGGTPWFLEVEAPRHPASQHAASLPKPPDDSPDLLAPLIKYVYEDMGLDELALLDLRDLDPPAALGPNLIMLIATARSERHLHVSAGRLVKWLRRNYKVSAKAGGLIGPGELKTKLRRLRKKAKLLGTNTAIVPGGDNGISTGWVCVNFAAPGGQTGEATKVDEEGKFSGFGSALTGTTLVVQCMTESRRHELDLETLWQGILKRSLRQQEEIKGHRRPNDEEIQTLVSSRLQLYETPSSMQWQALQQASSQQHQQKRFFSTSLRRTNTSHESPPEATLEPGPKSEEVAPTEPPPMSLADLEKSVAALGTMAQPIENETILAQLVSNVLIMPLAEENTAAERIELLDQLLLTAHERGMKIMSTRIMVVLIDGLVRSPAWGEETERAQTNMEMLLSHKQTQLDVDESRLLMDAHASRQDWKRFWNIFNWNTRFAVPRPFGLYEEAFRHMANTGDAKLCLDALRTVWPEFASEKHQEESLQTTLNWARACITTAAPEAQSLVDNPMDTKIHQGARHIWFRHHECRRLLLEVMKLEARLKDKATQNAADEMLSSRMEV